MLTWCVSPCMATRRRGRHHRLLCQMAVRQARSEDDLHVVRTGECSDVTGSCDSCLGSSHAQLGRPASLATARTATSGSRASRLTRSARSSAGCERSVCCYDQAEGKVFSQSSTVRTRELWLEKPQITNPGNRDSLNV